MCGTCDGHNLPAGYGPEESNTVFELTYNWDRKEPYDKGGGYAQMAISTKVMRLSFQFIRAPLSKLNKRCPWL